MKTIIVTTDYSDVSRNAAMYAAALAQRTGAKIILYHAFFVHVIPTEVPVNLPAAEELTSIHVEKLGKIAQEITQRFGIQVEFITDSIPVVDALPKLVTQHHAELVVMGMRGLGTIDQRVFGSITVAVIRQVKSPVLVVPEEARYRDLTKIMFACDYQSLASSNKLTPLKELALTFNATVQVLHIDQPGAENTGKKLPDIENLLQGVKHEYVFLQEDDILEGIEKGISEYQPDLLVMIPREHSFWDVLLNRSTTRKVAYQTHIPLLTIPNPKGIGSSFKF